MEALYPEDDGPEAREGTAAHYYPTEYLQGRAWPVGTITPNGHPLDADMIKYGSILIDDVNTTIAAFDHTSLFRVETKVFAHSLVHPLNEGTPDAFLISLILKRLVVWDYKYGHKIVDPYRCWQVIDYIAGIFEGLGLHLTDIADMAISIRIVQPRAYSNEGPVRTWETTGAVIWGLINQLRDAAWKAKTPGAPTQTGDHCTDCSARHACDTFKRVAAHAIDIAGQATPDVLPNDALGVELKRIRRAMKRLKAREDGLQAQAVAIINGGGRVPGWKKGFVDSREKWNVPVPQVVAMGALMGVDLNEPTAKSPVEARRLGIDPALVKAFSVKPTGAAKLEPVDEDAEAAKIFAPPPPKP